MILIGIHAASHGVDLGEIRLIDLIERIARTPGLRRVCLSSVDPRLVTEDFIQRLRATGKVCNHLHLSMQHVFSKILKAMNQKYSQEDFLEKTEIIRKYIPYVGLTTDCTVGFPGEEEEDFEVLKDLVKKVGFPRIHVFPYSPREGTKAASMEQLDDKIKQARSKALLEVGEELFLDFIDQSRDRDLEVLFEKEEGGFYHGYTTNYIRVVASSQENLTNRICHGTIKDKTVEPVESQIRR